MAETKQQIKDRLLKNASALWGLKETQSEQNFDPLVGLLFGACATELEKISHDIEDSSSRILERLVQLLFPEVLTTAIPAHAIAYAEPMDARFVLPVTTQFYVQKSVASANDNYGNSVKDIFFTPSLNTTLCKSAIKYFATAQSVYKTGDSLSKELLTRIVPQVQAGQQSTIWLGIENGNNILSGASFYFELRNEAAADVFYRHLPEVQWFMNGVKQVTTPGYFDDAADRITTLQPQEIVEGNRNITRQMLNAVNQLYRKQFVALRNTNWVNEAVYPSFVNDASIPDNEKKEMKQLLWVQLKFPETITLAQLNELHVGLNCFPVVNRKHYSLQQRLLRYINIIPLQTDNYFLDLFEITNDEGKPVKQNMTSKPGSLSVSMRYGGVSRFSGKDAVVTIESLLQQIKDESAAYAVIGNDFLSSELTILQQTINKLQLQLTDKHLQKSDHPYLVFTGTQNQSPVSVFISYWGTQGEEANNIKSGAEVFLHKNVEVSSSSLQLVTGVKGGRDPLSETQKILAYKSALLSKEKLVTREDITSFCKMRLGIEDGVFEVERGFTISGSVNKSFSKTVDVKIKLNERDKETIKRRGGIESCEQELTEAVTERSNFFMPVRVMINR
jgi:hypothetical protein